MGILKKILLESKGKIDFENEMNNILEKKLESLNLKFKKDGDYKDYKLPKFKNDEELNKYWINLKVDLEKQFASHGFKMWLRSPADVIVDKKLPEDKLAQIKFSIVPRLGIISTHIWA